MPAPATGPRIEVPAPLAASQQTCNGAAGLAWIAALPALAADWLDHWRLRLDGSPAHGMTALVLPVIREDGTAAALKLQPVDQENAGEPVALRAWNGDGAVRLLHDDPATGTMLLERLDSARPLSRVHDDTTALRILSELPARLVSLPAPDGLRHLADVAAAMVDQAPRALPSLRDPSDRLLVRTCADVVRELLPEPGDRLLHWDLHHDNVLASHPSPGREPWLAIDPKPLAGDPGFDLLPALDNRWDRVAATGDVPRAVRRRFDLMTEIAGPGPAARGGLDPRPGAAERPVGRRGRQNRPAAGAGGDRPGPAGRLTCRPTGHDQSVTCGRGGHRPSPTGPPRGPGQDAAPVRQGPATFRPARSAAHAEYRVFSKGPRGGKSDA